MSFFAAGGQQDQGRQQQAENSFHVCGLAAILKNCAREG
jgi:hypothetical protein